MLINFNKPLSHRDQSLKGTTSTVLSLFLVFDRLYRKASDHVLRTYFITH